MATLERPSLTPIKSVLHRCWEEYRFYPSVGSRMRASVITPPLCRNAGSTKHVSVISLRIIWFASSKLTPSEHKVNWQILFPPKSSFSLHFWLDWVWIEKLYPQVLYFWSKSFVQGLVRLRWLSNTDDGQLWRCKAELIAFWLTDCVLMPFLRACHHWSGAYYHVMLAY